MAGIPTLDWFTFDEDARVESTPRNSGISDAEYEQRRYSEQIVASAKRETRFTSGAVQQQQVMYNPPREVQGSVLLNNEGRLEFEKWLRDKCGNATRTFRYRHYSLSKLVAWRKASPQERKEKWFDLSKEDRKTSTLQPPRTGKLYTAQFIGFPQISANGAIWSVRFFLRLYDNLEEGF